MIITSVITAGSSNSIVRSIVATAALVTPACMVAPDEEALSSSVSARMYVDRIEDAEIKAWARQTPRLPPFAIDRSLNASRFISAAEMGQGAANLSRVEYGGAETVRDAGAILASLGTLWMVYPDAFGYGNRREEKFLQVRVRPLVEINADAMVLRREPSSERLILLVRAEGKARAVVTAPTGTMHLFARRIDYRAGKQELLLLGYPSVLAGSRSASVSGESEVMRLDLRSHRLWTSSTPRIEDKP